MPKSYDSHESGVKMKKPFVISVAAQSGGGKTTIVTALKERLDNSVVIYWDDYGDEVDLDRDINDWAAEGLDYIEWNTQPVAIDIERLLNEPHDYIILDYPFGYLNDCVGKYIDLTVFIDTPLDVALARRIIRDYTSRSQESDFGLADVEELSFAGLDKELRWYLTRSRPTYAKMPEMHKPVSDLVVDGTKTQEEITDEIIQYITIKGEKDGV
jgi:uridine kinase